MWLKGAVGKVGDSTLYASGGETILRNGKSNVKNPQSYAQMIQRVIAKTAMNNYSALQFIANHSFQGRSTGAKCMERFLSRNMRYFRERAAEIQGNGGSLYEFVQFSPVGSVKYVPAAVILSEGKLPPIITGIEANGTYAFCTPSAEGNTYAAIVESFDLKRGDQITFVTIEKSVVTGDYTPRYARVILDPRNADGTPAPMSSQFIVAGGNFINLPNMRNRGGFAFLQGGINGGRLGFRLSSGSVAAAGIIVSRKVKGAWWRSNCKLVINEDVIGSDLMSLAGAVDASLSTNEIYSDDDLYLNNAGTGGVQSAPQNVPVSDNAVVNDTVEINGLSQNVAGGSVSTIELNTLKVFGANLQENTLSIKPPVGEAEPFVVAADGKSAVYTGTGERPERNETWAVYFNGNVWFNLIIMGNNLDE